MSIEIKVKESAVWISVRTSDGNSGMICLNNIVNDMNPKGFTKQVFVDALSEAMGSVGDRGNNGR